MDIIYLNDLRVDTIIGINEWERRTRQTVILDIEFAADARKAAASDMIDDTLDYKSIAETVVMFASKSEFNLIETLAENIAALLLREFGVTWCKVRLNKQGAVPGVRDVGVIIERGRKE